VCVCVCVCVCVRARARARAYVRAWCMYINHFIYAQRHKCIHIGWLYYNRVQWWVSYFACALYIVCCSCSCCCCLLLLVAYCMLYVVLCIVGICITHNPSQLVCRLYLSFIVVVLVVLLVVDCCSLFVGYWLLWLLVVVLLLCHHHFWSRTVIKHIAKPIMNTMMCSTINVFMVNKRLRPLLIVAVPLPL